MKIQYIGFLKILLAKDKITPSISRTQLVVGLACFLPCLASDSQKTEGGEGYAEESFDFHTDRELCPHLYRRPIPLIVGPLEFGLRGEVFNVTNQQKVARNDQISVTPNFNLANPFQYFGQATSRTALQAPRNYCVSWFVRF
jgi:hypothetical protein